MSPGGRADAGGRVPPGKASATLAKKRSREPSEDSRISSKGISTLTEKSVSPASPHMKKKKLVESNPASKKLPPSSSSSSSISPVSTASPSSAALGQSSSSGSRMNPFVKSTKKRQREESEATREAPVDEKIGGYVSSTLVRKALGGLTGYVLKKSREQDSQNLLQEAGASTVSLMLALKNIPEAFRKKPVQIVLPHALLDATGGGGEVCLFVRDPQRKWKDLLAKERLPLITRVIGISKVKKKFPTFQDRRVLCAAYDMFLCDRRISDKLTPLLGKPFIQSKKLPLPIKVSADNIRPSIEEALRSTYFFLPRGPCVAIKIGRANMPVEHLFENAKTALNAAFDFFSGDSKFQNVVHAVSVQATNAPALPLYTHASYAQAAQHYISTKPPATKLGKAGKPKAGSTPAFSPTKEETKSGDMGKKKIGKVANGTAKQGGAMATKKSSLSEKLNGKLSKGDRLNGDASQTKHVKGMNKVGEVASSGIKKSGVPSVAKETKHRPPAKTSAAKKTSVGAVKGNNVTKKRKVEKA